MTNLNSAPGARSIEIRDYMFGVFGSPEADVFAYDAPDADLRVGVIHAPNSPEAGLTTYATVNLNEIPNVINGQSVPAELYGVVEGVHDGFAGALATIGLNRFLGDVELAPGTVLRTVFAQVSPGLPHALLVYPMDWGEELSRMRTSQGDVFGLQVIPISDAEVNFLVQHGFEELDDRLAEAEIDYLDFNRPSAC